MSSRHHNIRCTTTMAPAENKSHLASPTPSASKFKLRPEAKIFTPRPEGSRSPRGDHDTTSPVTPPSEVYSDTSLSPSSKSGLRPTAKVFTSSKLGLRPTAKVFTPAQKALKLKLHPAVAFGSNSNMIRMHAGSIMDIVSA